MKHNILLISIILPTLSFAMKPSFAKATEDKSAGKPEIEIRNRELDTLEKPHITIINKLPKDAGYSTRIDISDKTKINEYTKDSYRPDESTTTIYSGNGIRFSPYLNKNGKAEHQRLGMNDAGNAAYIALYIHGARNNSLHHLVIGKGSYIPFNDTIIITAEPDGTIYFDSNNNDDRHWKTPITSDSEEQKSIAIIGLSESGFRVQFSKDNTSSSDSDDLSDSDKK